MGKTAVKEKQEAKKDVPLEDIIFESFEEEEEENTIGIPVVEKQKAESIGTVGIPLGYNRNAKVGKDDVTVCIRFQNPAKVEPDKYYPAVEWRITGDRMNEVDYAPVWKKLPLFINDQIIMESGRQVKISYYNVISVQDMSDDTDGGFFTNPPFSRMDMIEMSDFGVPVVKGDKIIALEQAKRLLGNNPMFAARQRVGELGA